MNSERYLDKGINLSVINLKGVIKKDIVKFLKENHNSTIIFTGSNTITQSNDFSDAIYYNIEAEHKFFIDIDLEVVLKRRFDRHIKYMNWIILIIILKKVKRTRKVNN